MQLSAFGKKFGGSSAIVNLMDDLGHALSENPDIIFMGGGNPAHLPAVEERFHHHLQILLADPDQRKALFGVYQSPQGEKKFRQELANFLKNQFGWQLTADNIAVSNGSQPAFFVLYNLLAGEMPDGSQSSIHLPLVPEYLGYKDVGLSQNFFTATLPQIELLDEDLFKYHVNFADLHLEKSAAALCVSRPTNPTGNVLTDSEIEQLDEVAQRHKIPLIIDGAYGLPFPGIIFSQASSHWNENMVLALSLSKLGLPGVRTGILIGCEELIHAFTNANTIVSLACGTLGPALGLSLLKSGELQQLSRDHIAPHYQRAATQVVLWLRHALQGLPFRIHKPEGAIFLWLWLQDLPISSQELYQRLKQRGVLVVPGEDFFVGVDDHWQHKHECIRISYAQESSIVARGVTIIAEEVKRAYL